jgi:hypothetical protein
MMFAATISSTAAINSPTAIFRLITSLLAASVIRILNGISLYRRTVGIKRTRALIKSI